MANMVIYVISDSIGETAEFVARALPANLTPTRSLTFGVYLMWMIRRY